MVANWASCETIWIRKLLVGLFGQELRPTVIYCDNQSYMNLSKNIFSHDGSKYIEIMYHFIHDYVERGVVELQYIPIENKVENILTKPLGRGKFDHFKDKLGVVRNTHSEHPLNL